MSALYRQNKKCCLKLSGVYSVIVDLDSKRVVISMMMSGYMPIYSGEPLKTLATP